VLDAATLKVLEANPAAQQLLGDGTRSLAGRAFPFGIGAQGSAAVQAMLAGVRATGHADEVIADLADGRGRVRVAASAFQQQGAVQLLLRLSRAAGEGADAGAVAAAPSVTAMLADLARGAPDGLVVTDMDGRILGANAAFVELVQLGSEEQARGESLDRWLGRTGVDLSVLVTNLRQRGAVRLFATTMRGEFGSTTEVEISATRLARAEPAMLGFAIRDVGRRLGNAAAGRELPRSVSQLTELVGRVPLKDIVGETTDLIEQLCIEAALELTRDNRASAAEMLGLSRQSLYVKLRRYGLGDLGNEPDKTAK
jgi:transcriptional regulator PpsR